ncbi:MAG: NUDIX domain-containing protein [Myxococcales bacterium]
MQFCPRCAEPLVDREHAGRVRRVCAKEGCGFVFYDNPLPVLAAVVEHPDGVLLVRNHGWPEKMFGLVSGFLERDESPEDGVLREVKEELGLDGELVGLIGVYPFTLRNELIVAYHVRASGPIRPGEEIAGYKAIPPEKLRSWPFGTGLALEEWLRRRLGASDPGPGTS